MFIVSPDHYERLSASFERVFGRPLPVVPSVPPPSHSFCTEEMTQMLADPDLFAGIECDSGAVWDELPACQQAPRLA